jgi:hypothetical protein
VARWGLADACAARIEQARSLAPGDRQELVAGWAEAASVSASVVVTPARTRDDTMGVAALTVRAWNAWLKGRHLSKLQIGEADCTSANFPEIEGETYG